MRGSCQVIFLIVSVSYFSCDTSTNIDPFEEDTFSFSIYGAVDLNSDENYIRIRDVSVPLLADSGVGYENIVVRLEDIDSGEEIELIEKVININGNYTLNYLIEEDLYPSKTYDFSISNELGGFVNSVFNMPGISTLSMNRRIVENCTQNIRFTWENVIKPEYILVEAGAMYNGRLYWGELKRVDEPDHVPGENKMEMSLSVNQMLVDIFPPPNVVVPNPDSWRPEVECQQLDSRSIFLRYIHFGSDWEQFEESRYFVDDFHESGQVENGFGFLGGIRRGEFSFEVEQ